METWRAALATSGSEVALRERAPRAGFQVALESFRSCRVCELQRDHARSGVATGRQPSRGMLFGWLGVWDEFRNWMVTAPA